MDLNNPDRDNEDLYTNEGPDSTRYHRYDRERTFATSAQTLNTDQKLKDIALTLHQPREGETKQQAAYYYPIISKVRLKPERARTIAQAGLAPTASQAPEEKIDQLHVTVRDPDGAEVYKRSLHRANVDPKFEQTLPPPPAEEDVLEEEEGGDDTRMSDE
jgi:hypothetical protein